MLLKNYIGTQVSAFLATPVALHLTPVSGTVGRSAEFWTSIVSRLVSLFYSRKNESICKVVLASWQGALQSFWCQPPDNSCAPLRSTHRLDLSRIFLVQCHQNIVNFTAALKLPSSSLSGANSLSGAEKLRLVCVRCHCHCLPPQHFYVSLSLEHITTQALLEWGWGFSVLEKSSPTNGKWSVGDYDIWVVSQWLVSIITIRSCQVASGTHWHAWQCSC